jgi:pimeloyl-ACP methyl ester carboxylesterase
MNLRTYGDKPYKVAVIHGGPGAAGSVKPICEELSKFYGVLEPLQTEMSVEGQLHELKEILEANTEEPITLIGHSWGAMLIYMFAGKFNHLVNKIILVSSGSLEEKYYDDLQQNRQSKLTQDEKAELKDLQNIFSNPYGQDMNKVFTKFGTLMEKLDSYAPIEMDNDSSLISYEIFSKVWPEAHGLRKSGLMYEMGKDIECEVIAIHGDYDSHPVYGIKDSLEKIVKRFEFYKLEKCGHSPWLETYARDEFYRILRNEIQ